MKHGKGEFLRADGSKYNGEFKEDKVTGKGTLIETDGSKYEGMF